MAETKSLEQVLKEFFNPTDTKKAKGEPKYIIVVNGSVITNRIKGKKALEQTLRSVALNDSANGTETKVLVYKLEGEAKVDFPSTVTVGTQEEGE